MQLEITATKGGEFVSLETYIDIPLDTAFEHAKNIVNLGLADRVEIKHGDKLVRQWPRTLRPGNPN